MVKQKENNDNHLGDLWQDPKVRADFEASIDEGMAPFLVAIGVILITVIAVCSILLYLTWPRMTQFSAFLPFIVSGVFGISLLYFCLEYIAFLLTALFDIPLAMPLARKIRGAVKLSPIALKFSRIFGKTQDRMAHSFVRVNNALIKSYTKKTSSTVLVLLPRCLQNSQCQQTVTEDVDNCVRCGKCSIPQMLDLREEYENVAFAVLTGGSVIQSMIEEVKPKVIIGVACEREVLLGIESVESIPVVGVCNTRPEGPCVNTQVSLDDLRESINHFAVRKKEAALSK